jgi:hypothetical protein
MAQYIPLATIETRLKRLDEQEQDMLARLERLDAEKKLLQSLRREAIAVTGVAASSKKNLSANGAAAPAALKLSIKQELTDFIRAHPGQNSAQIATALRLAGVAKSSKEPKKTIQTLLGQLRERGQVLRDGIGHYTVP